MKANRYIRQTVLKDFGPEKQEMLRRAKVLVVGAGGLGIPVLQYLTAMGTGTLGVVEQDTIDLSNLQRQVLYGESDIGRSKLEVVADRLRAMNSDSAIRPYDTFLTRYNALDILEDYDLVIDSSDNFPTRYLINDACVILNKPFVSGAVQGFDGQVSVYNYEDGPTYRCLFPDPPEPGEIQDCNSNGVLGVIPGIIGTMQAFEAVKVLTRMAGILKGVLLLYDGMEQQTRRIRFSAKPENKRRTKLEDTYEHPGCEQVSAVGVDFLRSELSSDREGTYLIDVRDRAEFGQDGLPEAVNIPMEELIHFAGKIPVDKNLYFICRSGVRSREAIKKLRSRMGETRMYSVDGGMLAWQSQFGVTGK
jgi:adenylyltransferase/sulfurtransferase